MIDFKSNIVLKGRGILLRPWEPGDADLVIDAVTNPIIWKYTTEALSSKDDVLRYVSRAITDREAGQRYSFAVQLDGSKTIIGSSSFGSISKKDGRIEIGWTWLAPEYHGKGINTIVKHLLLKYGFEELRAHRIEFKTDNSNPRSCGALEKIGAKRDGVLRSHTLMHDGRYRDTVYYSILQDEWANVGSALESRLAAQP